MARDPGGALPPTLLAAVRLEVGAMPPAARALLDGAAVAGDPFDPELAAAAAGLDAADALAPLDRLVAADLVCATGDGRAFRFRHPLLRRAVYDAAPPAWRLAAHERVAAALAARGAGASVRAFHVEKCARPGDDAAVALLRRGRRGGRRHRAGHRRALVRAPARGCSPTPTARERAEPARPDGASRSRAPGGCTRAARRCSTCSPCSPPSAPPSGSPSSPRRAGVEHLLGRHGDAHRRLLAALEDAPPEGRAALALEMAAAGFYAGDAAAMRDWAARAAGDADGQDALRAGAEGLGALGAQRTGDADAAATLLARAIDRLARIDDPEIGAGLKGAVHVATAALLGERFEDGYATLDRALSSPAPRARTACSAGSRSPARSSSSSGSTSARRSPTSRSPRRAPACRACAACSTRRSGRRRCCTTTAARAPRPSARPRSPPSCSTRSRPSALTRTGRCAVAAIHEEQDPERCIREMIAAGGPMLEGVDETWRTWLLLVLVRAAIATEPARRGARVGRPSWPATPRRWRCPPAPCAPRAREAELLLAGGDAAAAGRVAMAAAERAGRIGARRDELAARLLAGRALAAAGDRTEAVAVLRAVTVDAARGGAFMTRDAAARELRRLGSRVSVENRRAVGGEGPRSLTARELDVARLVAEGRPNKQVAAALFLSEKTVEHHLSRVYAKYGVRSRAELTAVFAREGWRRRPQRGRRAASASLGERRVAAAPVGRGCARAARRRTSTTALRGKRGWDATFPLAVHESARRAAAPGERSTAAC